MSSQDVSANSPGGDVPAPAPGHESSLSAEAASGQSPTGKTVSSQAEGDGKPLPPSRPKPGPIVLKLPRSPWRLALVIVAAAMGALVFAMLVVTAFDYTESTAFCSTCHVMSPEVTAHHSSPHARTECGTCHVGPGAVAAVQAKLANVRYLWVYPLHLYPKPIPSPIHSLRPVEVVCEQCHWPQKFYSDRLMTVASYAQDEANSLTRTEFMLRTGGGSAAAGLGRGIHWHIENPVYYIATDEKRQNIPWVQAEFNGVTTVYMATDSTLTPDQIAKAEKRKMDCVDCHNRATHLFRNPDTALNEAMANGTIAADLPYIKREGSRVLLQTYASEQEAAKAIAGIEDFYRANYPDVYAKRTADIKAAVATLQAIFNVTQFPFMNVTWQSHTNNIGHTNFPGCWRCHDGKHLSSDNQAIRLECNICHTIPQVAGPGKALPPITTSTGPEPASHKTTSWLSDHRYKFDATCATCHTVSNPGGSDNTSFCSNSACHGSQWKYIGLNAPKIRELSAPPQVPATGTPAAIPHPVSPTTNCLLCHAAGKVRPFPANHASFTVDMCTTCHKATLTEGVAGPTPTAQPSAPAAPTATRTVAIPSPTVGPATPTVAATPSLPATSAATSPTAAAAGGAPAIPHTLAGRDNCLQCHDPAGGIKPAPKDHIGRTNDTCQLCHKPK